MQFNFDVVGMDIVQRAPLGQDEVMAAPSLFQEGSMLEVLPEDCEVFIR